MALLIPAARISCRIFSGIGVFVKVILYDYTADLTGTALVMIPAPK